MKSNKVKAALLAVLLCTMLVSLALLLPSTLAKYKDEIDGYISFNIGSFNAAITQTNVSTDPTQSVFVEYSQYDFKPGMKSKELNPALTDEENTAATTKFRVANGNTASDAASTPLQYTIRIRTSNTLPLKYTLKSTMISSDGTETVVYNQPLTEPLVIEKELSEPRYEYQFNEEPSEGGGEAQAEYTEMAFRLEQGTAENPLVYRDHELIAEWSAELEYAQSKYMKEVEIVEILVTVISLNKTEDYNPEQTFKPGDYSDGIIVIMPPTGGATTESYNYNIDLRSFKQGTGTEPSKFNFTLNNGLGLGLGANAPLGAKYKLILEVPAEIIEAEGEDKWSFGLYRSDDPEITTNFLQSAKIEWRLYKLKEGTYTAYSSRAAVPAVPDDEKTQYRLYYAYEITLGEHDTLYYRTPNNVGGYDLTIQNHKYTLTADNFAATDDPVAFLNKLKLTVEAQFTPVPAMPTPPPPSTEDDGSGETE